MSAMLSVATRELREKKFVFVAAVVVSLLPVIAALLPQGGRWARAELVTMLGAVLAIGFSLALAVALGSSTIGRDLSDNRLSFYLSQPISPSALWFGKAVASIVTIFACLALTLAMPATLVFTSARGLLPANAGMLVAGAALLAVTLFAASHAVSSMIRSRTTLVLVDLLLAIVTGVALWFVISPLTAAMATTLAGNMVVAFVVALTALLLVAPAWQLSRGRADRERGHRELSKFLWIGMAVLLVGTGAVVAAMLSTGPEDLKVLAARSLPGQWFVAGGHPREENELNPHYLVNKSTGEYVRLSSRTAVVKAMSHDGNVVAWTDGNPFRWTETCRFSVRDLKTGRTTELSREDVMAAALSADGTRLAMVGRDGQLAVQDLRRDALLASVRVPDPWRVTPIYFVDPNLVRFVKDGVIRELDVRSRAVTETGRVAAEIRYVTPDGSRAIAGDALIDARSGKRLATLTGETPALLTDGNIASIVAGKLRVATLDGRTVREITLPGRDPFVDAEVAPGKLVVAGKGWVQTVDVATGRVVREARNVGLVSAHAGLDPQPRVCYVAWNKVVSWNPLTGEQKKLF
jgi:ABC-type transport system involved in multi-copper enzyme maturation permease subunit